MSNLRDNLLDLASRYATATNTRGRDGRISLSGISTKIFNDGKTLDRLAAGRDITIGSFERAVKWFDANWPAELAWPDGLPRPSLIQSSLSASLVFPPEGQTDGASAGLPSGGAPSVFSSDAEVAS